MNDLQQLFYLSKMIDRMNDQLEDLREKLDLHSPTISDMPKAPGSKDKIGDIVPEIVDKTRELEAEIHELERRSDELHAFIRQVPNIRIRLIMTYRYIDQLSWMEVAHKIGGRETEQTVSQTVYRYLKEKNEQIVS